MDQASVHNKVYSVASEERMKAVKQLGAFFESFPDRKLAFEDLLRLCSDENNTVREESIISLTTVFPNVPDPELAWERFLNLTAYPSERILNVAVKALITVFPLMPDKNRAWKEIFGLIISESSFEDVSLGISNSLSYITPQVPDKQQVWDDLLEMVISKDGKLRQKAASLLIMVFPELEESKKEKAWKKLIRLAVSESRDVQKEIFLALPLAFASLQNRSNACNDILELTQHENKDVRRQATDTFIAVFPQILETAEKMDVWENFLGLMNTEDDSVKDIDTVKDRDTKPLLMEFPELNYQKRAWETLIMLTEDKDEAVQKKAVDALIDTFVKVFQDIPDKKKALEDLIYLAEKKSSPVLRKGVKVLTSLYPETLFDSVSDHAQVDMEDIDAKLLTPFDPEVSEEKEEKGENGKLPNEKTTFLQRIANNSLSDERKKPDLDQKRLEFGRATHADSSIKTLKSSLEDSLVNSSRNGSVSNPGNGLIKTDVIKPSSPGSEIQNKTSLEFQDKKEVVAELLRLSSDSDPLVRRGAIETLLAEGKNWAFFDLVHLASGQNSQFRKEATELLLKAFPRAGDKQEAWAELVSLTSSGDREIRKGAAIALFEAYFQVPDKDRAWRDLFRLSEHNDSFVQRASARILAPAFFHLQDKTRAWKDLQVLSNDPYTYVRKYAFRALARACLWRSLKAENEAAYIFGLKEAVSYFKEADEVPTKANIFEYYLPFYEAFLYITASDTPEKKAQIEVERYLSKVTEEIQGYGESQKFLEIINNLATLLQEAGKLDPEDLHAKKALLETCILTFDRAVSLFDEAEERAILEKKNTGTSTGTTTGTEHSELGKTLMVKKMKEAISGIRYQARVTCLKSTGTPGQSLTCALSQKVREWKFEDLDKDGKELNKQLESLLNLIRSKIPYVSENMQIFEKIEEIRQERDMLERYRKVSKLFSLLPRAKILGKR